MGIDEKPLNPEQQRIVDNVFGPVLVVASVGTGKTRVRLFVSSHRRNERGWNRVMSPFVDQLGDEVDYV